MKKKIVILSALITLFFIQCKETTTADSKEENEVSSVMTAQEQASLSPAEIIERLKKGNQNFQDNNLTQRNHNDQVRKATEGQYPKAFVLSCVDSRVPVEDVFDLGIGDIFVGRVAGNIENDDLVGSMEFATAVAGSKVVVIMGHESCGAIKHAIDQTDAASLGLNSLSGLLGAIQPSVEQVIKDGEERSSKNSELLHNVIEGNVQKTIENIRKKSPQMTKLEEEGKLKIVGAVYDMDTGKVNFL